MNHAAAIAWLDWWYSTPDTSPPGYWDAFEADIEGNQCMQVTKNVHAIIELDEEETAMLRCLLTMLSDTAQHTLDQALARLVTDLRFMLPAGS